MDPIPLSLPWFDETETERVAQALAGRVAGDGPFCRQVEARLERQLGSAHVLLTTSCTHALELSLLALGIGPGREVICPSFTFVSTANAILRAGARPIFADIEDLTLGLDPADVARRITPRTAAILPVHYAGVAPDMQALAEVARTHDLAIVEDAAQGFGASYRGQSLGTLGDAGCFSFHETKNLTCGEGGALALREDAVAARAEIIREKGTNRSAFLRGQVDKYTWVAEGSSYVLSDVLAAILDAQLDKHEEIARRRKRIAERYAAELADWAGRRGARLPAELPDRQTNHHLFFLLLPDEGSRNRLMGHLRERGIQASFHYVPLHTAPHGRTLGEPPALPVTDRVASTLLRLPMHPLMTENDLRRVTETVRGAPL